MNETDLDGNKGNTEMELEWKGRTEGMEMNGRNGTNGMGWQNPDNYSGQVVARITI